MTTFKVDIFHNVTTTGEAAAKGDEDCARLVAADAGYGEGLAIFSRLRGASKARPGDRLRKVVTLTLDADDSRRAADAAFEAGNSPYVSPSVRAYRAAQVRSLSTGDVVVAHTPDGPGTYVCESSGWSDAALADFEIEEG